MYALSSGAMTESFWVSVFSPKQSRDQEQRPLMDCFSTAGPRP